MFAATDPVGLGVVIGFILGVFIIGFIWVVVSGNQYNHEGFYEGHYYTTKRANRIVGVVGESIVGGKWIAHIKSLWRMFPDNGFCRFFILRIDELNSPKILPVTPDEAKKFITESVSAEEAGRLIHDWMVKK